MRILHAGPESLTARHVPWFYWLLIALLLGAAIQQAPSHARHGGDWVETVLLTLAALVLVFYGGQVVQLEIDRRRKRLVLKRWGPLGLRVRVFPISRITAIYLERDVDRHRERLTRHRLVLLDQEQQTLRLIPPSLVEGDLQHTAERMHHYLGESRNPPAAPLPSRP